MAVPCSYQLLYYHAEPEQPEQSVVHNVLPFSKSQALLEDQMVVAVPGIDFGLDGYLRVSYALSEDRMGEAVDRIAKFITNLS